MLYYNEEVIPLYPLKKEPEQQQPTRSHSGQGFKEQLVDTFLQGLTDKVKKIDIDEDIVKPASRLFTKPESDVQDDKKLDAEIEKQRRKMIKAMIGKGCCGKSSSKIMNYL